MTDSNQSIDVDALVFDAYGTLFDVHSLTALAEELVPGRGPALSQLWRAKQLEYSWLGSLMSAQGRPKRELLPPGGKARSAKGAHITSAALPRADFAAVTAAALDYALEVLGIGLGAGERGRLREAYLTLAPFPDAAPTLALLAPRPRWILSNGTLGMLLPLVHHAGFDGLVDGVLSVDAAGIYKPSPRVYRLAVDQLQLPAERIGFVSSNCWDAIGAKAFGFATFWINRANAPVDRHGPAPDRVITTLAELPPLLAWSG